MKLLGSFCQTTHVGGFWDADYLSLTVFFLVYFLKKESHLSVFIDNCYVRLLYCCFLTLSLLTPTPQVCKNVAQYIL